MQKRETSLIDSYEWIESKGDSLYTEKFIQALQAEDVAITENDLSPEEEIQAVTPEVMERALLKRDLRKAAIARMEDAARTEDDFREVVKAWDKEDANRERRERYHEVGRDNSLVPLEYNMSQEEIIIPAPIHSVYWRQIMKGEFLDAIFDCPYDLHELVTDTDISAILKGLTEKHKALFFFLVIRGYSASNLAKLYGQSDRNIRKVRATIERKIHKKLIPILTERIRQNRSLTLQERKFMEKHCEDFYSVI